MPLHQFIARAWRAHCLHTVSSSQLVHGGQHNARRLTSHETPHRSSSHHSHISVGSSPFAHDSEGSSLFVAVDTLPLIYRRGSLVIAHMSKVSATNFRTSQLHRMPHNFVRLKRTHRPVRRSRRFRQRTVGQQHSIWTSPSPQSLISGSVGRP